MTKTEKELKKEFSAYVKTAIKNTQKQYLIKKGKILDNEIAMDDEGIDEILQKQTEDLFDKMDLNVDMVLSDEINVNSFLDQINDPVLYVSLCSLKELQQKVLMLRIVYVKSFDDIGGILNMTAKQAETAITMQSEKNENRWEISLVVFVGVFCRARLGEGEAIRMFVELFRPMMIKYDNYNSYLLFCRECSGKCSTSNKRER